MKVYSEYTQNKIAYIGMFGGGDDITKSNDIKEIIFVRHAETDMNLKKVRYDNFDKDEYYPITERGKLMAQETGEYFTKYGQFDLIISSPRDRCIQTAEIIANKVKYDKKIEISDLLLESNAGRLQLMPHSQIKDQIINKNKKLFRLRKKIDLEQNEFKRSLLEEKFSRKFYKFTRQTSLKDLEKRYSQFLDYLIELKHKKIIVVCHSGTIYHIRSMVCNIGYGTNIKVTSNTNSEDYFNGNCSIMGMMYRGKKFSLIIPPNNKHLEILAKKYEQRLVI
jgi:broad specificity phosphatase PhoE